MNSLGLVAGKQNVQDVIASIAKQSVRLMQKSLTSFARKPTDCVATLAMIRVLIFFCCINKSTLAKVMQRDIKNME